jgi:hypothetical protein
MKVIYRIILCAVFLEWTGFLQAQNASGDDAPKNPGSAETPFERELAKFDKDKDGKLSKEERADYLAAQAKRREEHIKKWDKNGDGKLDEEEASEARASAKKALAEARRAEVEAKAKEKQAASPAKK